MTAHHDFSGQRVLVTGGAQGIGRAIVEAFARCGAQVLILDQTPADALVDSLRARGCEVGAVAIDLADAQAIQTLLAGLDRLDVLVHNAAFFPLTAFAEIDPALLQRTLAVNRRRCSG